MAYNFIAKLTDNGTVRTVRGKLESADAKAAMQDGLAKLTKSLASEGVDMGHVSVVMVKRIGSTETFKISDAKPVTSRASQATGAKRGRPAKK